MKITDFVQPDIAYAFGTSPQAAAESLGQMAAAIESGELIVQSARLTSLAKNDDYAITSLRIAFAEKLEPRVPASVNFFGAGPYPVDTQVA